MTESEYNWEDLPTASAVEDVDFQVNEEIHYLADSTKWKPGLNPRLMDEPNVEFELRHADELTQSEHSAIEMILSSVNAEKYLKDFQIHKVKYTHFLGLSEADLQEIGVENSEMRKKILCQNDKFRYSQLSPINVRSSISNAQTHCILLNLVSHLDHIASVMTDMVERIREDPENLRVGRERYPITDIIEDVKNVVTTTRLLKDCTNELQLVYAHQLNEGSKERKDLAGLEEMKEDKATDKDLSLPQVFKFCFFTGVALALGFYIMLQKGKL